MVELGSREVIMKANEVSMELFTKIRVIPVLVWVVTTDQHCLNFNLT